MLFPLEWNNTLNPVIWWLMWWMKNDHCASALVTEKYKITQNFLKSVQLVSNNSRVINSPQNLLNLIFDACKVEKTIHYFTLYHTVGNPTVLLKLHTSTTLHIFFTNLAGCLQGFSSSILHSCCKWTTTAFGFLLLVSMDTLFGFSSVCFDTQQKRQCVLFLGFLPTWWRSMALS